MVTVQLALCHTQAAALPKPSAIDPHTKRSECFSTARLAAVLTATCFVDHTDRKTDRQADGRTDRRTNIQTDNVCVITNGVKKGRVVCVCV